LITWPEIEEFITYSSSTPSYRYLVIVVGDPRPIRARQTRLQCLFDVLIRGDPLMRRGVVRLASDGIAALSIPQLLAEIEARYSRELQRNGIRIRISQR
jgi:hypothetical protein